jgi:hypothetical protein
MTATLSAYLARQPMPEPLAGELETERRRLGAIHGGDLAEEGLRLKAWNNVMARRKAEREVTGGD